MVRTPTMDDGCVGTSQHVEVERKYEVASATVLPDLTESDGVVFVRQPLERRLEAVYFDTTDLDLSRHGITLRRRSGGSDDGWHLKLPAGKDTRSEVRLPLEASVDTVPADLLTDLRAVVRDRALDPVARLVTRRLEYALQGEGSTDLALLCDDEVRAERLVGSPVIQDWREWEVELVDGDRDLLHNVEQVLVAGGATPAATTSKLARALADLAPGRPVQPSPGKPAEASAADLLLALVAELTERIQGHDADVRAEREDGVHNLRIACRRLRSALTTYRPLFEPGRTEPLREELRWLGQSLAEARDAQVMRERLMAMVDAEPGELVLGPVAQRISARLGDSYRAGREQAVQALDSGRYLRLLDALDELVRAAPLTGEAQGPARDVVPRLLRRDAKRLRRAVRAVEGADGAQRDLALHEVRKKAKRLRYAAESAEPVFGKRARSLAKSAKKVQQSLGLHQDAVVARQILRELGVQAHLSGENGFSFGRLHALEQMRATQAEQRFEKAWRKLPRKRLDHWVRR